MARPEWLTPPQHIEKPMRNIMLILDVSGSMAKNDVAGGSTRLEAVQASVKKFVAARPSDRIGLVIFANGAGPFAPISEDKQALETRINQLSPGMVGRRPRLATRWESRSNCSIPRKTPTPVSWRLFSPTAMISASQLTPRLAAKLAAAHHVQVHTIAFAT